MRQEYDVFISYAHADEQVVQDVDTELRHLFRLYRRPWKREALRTFRDRDVLVSGDLRSSLETAMRMSTWFLLVLSRETKRSDWVNDEIDYWLRRLQRPEHLIVLRCDRTLDLKWNESVQSFRNPAPLPSALVRNVSSVILYVDAPDPGPAARRATAIRIAARVRGMAPRDIESEDATVRRRSSLTLRGLGLALGISVVTSVSLTAYAVGLRSDVGETAAERRAAEASAIVERSETVMQDRPALGLAMAAEANALSPSEATAAAFQKAYLAYASASGRPSGTIAGFESPLRLLAVAQASGLIAVADDAGDVTILTAVDRETIASFHTGPAKALAFSPVDDFLAVASESAVSLREPRSGRTIRTLAGSDRIRDLAFDFTGSMLAAVGPDATLKVWDVRSGALLHNVPMSTPQHAVAFTYDAHVVTADNHDVVVWNPTTGQRYAEMTGGAGGSDVASDPTMSLVAVGGPSPSLWDYERAIVMPLVGRETQDVEHVAFAPDGQLATGGPGTSTTLWSTVALQIMTTEPSRQNVVDLAFVSDANEVGAIVATDVVAIENGDELRFWSTGRGPELVELSTGNPIGAPIALSSDGGRAALGANDAVKILDLSTGRLRGSVHTLNRVTDLALSGDGARLASVDSEGIITVWNAQTLTELAELREGNVNARASVALSSGERALAIWRDDGTIMVWDLVSGSQPRLIADLAEPIADVAISSDGSVVAVGIDGESPRVAVYDAVRGRQISAMAGYEGGIRDVAISGDSSRIAAISSAGTVRIWDAGDDRVLLAEGLPVGELGVAAISAEDGLVATLSGTSDKSIDVWDATTGSRVTTLPGSFGGAFEMSSFEGVHRLAAVDDEGLVRIMRLALSPEDACALVTGQVTESDLTSALGDRDPQVCTDLAP